MWSPTWLAKETLKGTVEKIIVLQTQSVYIIFLRLQAKKKKKARKTARWEEPSKKSDQNPECPVAERWDFSLLSFSWITPVSLEKHQENLNRRL